MYGMPFILRHLAGRVVTQEGIDKTAAICAAHFGNDKIFNREGWEYILKTHQGYLPLRIRAIPEGTVVPTRNVLMTVENTDPKVPFITNFVETLGVHMWYPITVATLSREIKRLILGYLNDTGTPEEIGVKLHDFGVRGASSIESAAIGGTAHLINFLGTDNVPALSLLWDMYDGMCAGISIPAAEHSTITSWGKPNEVDAYRNMLEQFPSGYVAIVSDSYDLDNACENLWGGVLRDMVLQREGVTVVRPDSGNPPEIVLKTVEMLGDKLGYVVNDKGFRVLDPHVRVIQGDGIEHSTIDAILANLKEHKWSADNVAFGMGGALLQQPHRDNLGFAFKASSIIRDGKQVDFRKEPKTDMGKQSMAGRMKLVRVEGAHGAVFGTVPESDERPDLLQTVYENGVLQGQDTSFEDIRERAAIR